MDRGSSCVTLAEHSELLWGLLASFHWLLFEWSCCSSLVEINSGNMDVVCCSCCFSALSWFSSIGCKRFLETQHVVAYIVCRGDESWRMIEKDFLSLEASIGETLFFNSVKAHCQGFPSLPTAPPQWRQGLRVPTKVTKLNKVIWEPFWLHIQPRGLWETPFGPLWLSLENWKFRQEEAPQTTNKLFCSFEGNGPKLGIFTQAELSLKLLGSLSWRRVAGLTLELFIRTSISEPPTGSAHLPKKQSSWEGSDRESCVEAVKWFTFCIDLTMIKRT